MEWKTKGMVLLSDHINQLDQLMKVKGYDGYFSSNFGHPDKLPGTLRKHIFECFLKNRNINPIHLSTYSKWKDNQSPYVRCDFDVRYDDRKGFSVTKIKINFNNQFGNIRSSEISSVRTEEIPHSEQANLIIDNPVQKRQNKPKL